MSPGAYIFQRPFLRGLFLEGLYSVGPMYGGKFAFSKSIGLALYWEGNLPFLFCFTYFVFEGKFQVQAPRGLIFGGAI